MLGGADNPNGELLSYIIGADSRPHLHMILVLLPGQIPWIHRCLVKAQMVNLAI